MKLVFFIAVVLIASSEAEVQNLRDTINDVPGFIQISPNSLLRASLSLREARITYWLSTTTTNFYGALSTCGRNGWKLVSIDARSKQDDLTRRVLLSNMNQFIFAPLWTSGRRATVTVADRDGDGVNSTTSSTKIRWTWGDGSTAQFQNFAPVYGELGGDCVQILPVTDTDFPKWIGANCFTSYTNFVCESEEYNIFPGAGE